MSISWDANVAYSANKLQNSHEISLSADLENSEQYIVCYAMCDDIGELVFHIRIRVTFTNC